MKRKISKSFHIERNRAHLGLRCVDHLNTQLRWNYIDVITTWVLPDQIDGQLPLSKQMNLNSAKCSLHPHSRAKWDSIHSHLKLEHTKINTFYHVKNDTTVHLCLTHTVVIITPHNPHIQPQIIFYILYWHPDRQTHTHTLYHTELQSWTPHCLHSGLSQIHLNNRNTETNKQSVKTVNIWVSVLMWVSVRVFDDIWLR